jgi:hypothetical protein
VLLKSAGQSPTIVLSAAQDADKVSALLDGQAIQSLASKDALLAVQTRNATYRLPVTELRLESLAKQLGAAGVSKITVRVDITKSRSTAVESLNTAGANGSFNLIGQPIDFHVTVSYNAQQVEVTRFTSYVQRELTLPAGTDRNQVITGVVLNADGTVRHVPTRVEQRNGKSVAVVSSLSNSTYALVERPVAFADMQTHWAKEAVHSLASRLVVNGVDDTSYLPDAAITRAQFAALIVRALGLAEAGTTSPYSDVADGEWYTAAVAKAKEYGLIDGYENGTFRPSQTITREEAMAILARAIKVTGMPVQANTDAQTILAMFADHADISEWAKSSAALVVTGGLVHGNGQSLMPKQEITRAESAAILQRLLMQSRLIDSR